MGDEGVLAAGVRAGAAVQEKHAASFAESLENLIASDSSGKAKLIKAPKVKPNDEEKGENEGKGQAKLTPLQIAQALCDEIKAESGKAFDYGMVLEAHKICADTAAGMKTHSTFLNEQYMVLTKLIQDDAPYEKFIPIMAEIEGHRKWFERKEHIAKTMVRSTKEKKDKSKSK